MKNILVIDDHKFEISKKDIKNMYLRVRSSEGCIAISAPKHISNETIRLFILSKLDWIKEKSERLQQQALIQPHEYKQGESLYIWGKEYTLYIVEQISPTSVTLIDRSIQLIVKPNASFETKKKLIDKWSREQLRLQANPLIEKWCPILGVSINKLYVRRMRSCWGSCNIHKETIRLNTELVKKPLECLEYVVVHELVHLLEPSHNNNFHKLMSTYLADWKQRKRTLNHFPFDS